MRRKRLSDKGNTFFVNNPENSAAEILSSLSVRCSKRGYPDLTVYNEDGSIYGFIEVKPDDRENLKTEQQVFEEFCSKHDVPFIMWRPKDGLEKIKNFLVRKED